MESANLISSWWLVIVYIWTIPWKGLALWKAAQRKEKWWFIFMLVLNTFALLEILYIYVFSRKSVSEKINSFFRKVFKR